MKDTCKRIRQLLDAQSMETALDRMASSVSEMIPAKDNVLVLGMASRGIPLAKKLAKRLSERYKVEIPCGSLDATFYRDDFHSDLWNYIGVCSGRRSGYCKDRR